MGRIVWIASYPKSGNTWVRAFLHDILPARSIPFRLDTMHETAANEAALEDYDMLDPRPWTARTPRDIARIRSAVHAAHASRSTADVFCKTHLAVMNAFGFPTINQTVTAGAIYIVRNPLDIAPSYADHQGVPLEKAIELMNLQDHMTPSTQYHVSEYIGDWSQNVSSWTADKHPAVHVMRYEDMTRNPEKEFGKLLSFFRLERPQRRIRQAIRNASFRSLRRLEETHGFAERSPAQMRFFRSGTVGHWCNALSKDQVASIMDKHRLQMQRFGYLDDT